MEDRRVFADTHFLVMRWLADGTLDGVRVDHIDGLRDPEQYLQWLHQAQPNAWILVEKILEAGESLRESWPIAGTTGYDFLNVVGALLVDPAGERPLTRFYTEFTGERTDFAQIVLEKKDLVMRDVSGQRSQPPDRAVRRGLRVPSAPSRLHAPRIARSDSGGGRPHARLSHLCARSR